ncbi:MAG: hypothetical protein V1887_03705 [Candidatus Aenigmatarchaeota archaeon]
MFNAKVPPCSVPATLFHVYDGDIILSKYVRLRQPLEEYEHFKIMLGTAAKFEGSLAPMKEGMEVTLAAKEENTRFDNDYKAYILKPEMIGIVIGTSKAKKADNVKEAQTVYLNRFNVWTANTDNAIEELELRYSAKGGDVYPKANMTYDEIMVCAEAYGLSRQEFSDGMDVALDINMIEKTGVVERIVDGKKMMVQSFGIPPDIRKSLDMFMKIIMKPPKHAGILPTHIATENAEH